MEGPLDEKSAKLDGEGSTRSACKGHEMPLVKMMALFDLANQINGNYKPWCLGSSGRPKSRWHRVLVWLRRGHTVCFLILSVLNLVKTIPVFVEEGPNLSERMVQNVFNFMYGVMTVAFFASSAWVIPSCTDKFTKMLQEVFSPGHDVPVVVRQMKLCLLSLYIITVAFSIRLFSYLIQDEDPRKTAVSLVRFYPFRPESAGWRISQAIFVYLGIFAVFQFVVFLMMVMITSFVLAREFCRVADEVEAIALESHRQSPDRTKHSHRSLPVESSGLKTSVEETIVSFGKSRRLQVQPLSEEPRRVGALEESEEESLETLCFRHARLQDLVRVLDRLVNVPVAFVYLVSVCQICFILFILARGFYPSDGNETLVTLLVLHEVLVVGFTLSGTWINEAAHSVRENLCKFNASKLSQAGFQSLSLFLAQVSGPPIGFTALGLFTIDRTVFLTVAGTLVTYALVLFQFNTGGDSGAASVVTTTPALNATVPLV